MSVTTTSNARILTTANYLADYDLHHSQPSSSSAAPAPAPNSQQHQSSSSGTSSSSPSASNPSGWETQWRRIPAYRAPVDQRDEMHDTYTSEIERNFVRVMFGGVFMMASASQIWRATGGRINGNIFKVKIGGEW